MEQAYRRLVKELTDNEEIVSIESNFNEIKIEWKSGIKERIVLCRRTRKKAHVLRNLRAIKWKPRMAPRALWWEDLSSGYEINYHYLYIDELINDPKDYPCLIEWKWSDFYNAGFYEQLLAVNDMINYIKKNRFQFIQYPVNILKNDLQTLLNENINLYKNKKYNIYKFSSHKDTQSGKRIIKHFMPYLYYGDSNPSYQLKIENKRDAIRVYKSIMSIIHINKNRTKKKNKKFINFNYETILKYSKKGLEKLARCKPYKFRNIGLYRLLIKDNELCNKSIYDIDPILGELALAAYIENCPYYYRPTCPFDNYNKNLADFLSTEFYEDDGSKYDFSIFDNGFFFDEQIFTEVLNILSNKVDTAIIYVDNENFDKFTEMYAPDDYYNLTKIMPKSAVKNTDGKWLIYHF